MNIKNGLPFRGTRNLSPDTAARDIKAFAEQVFETPQLIFDFKQYKKTYQKERDIEIDDFLRRKIDNERRK